jgi:hypothetical protein
VGQGAISWPSICCSAVEASRDAATEIITADRQHHHRLRKAAWRGSGQPTHLPQSYRASTEAVLALSRISSPSFGLPHSYVRRLFLTVVIPRMEYALPVWNRPVSTREGARHKGKVWWVAKALWKVQRQACKMITGALRTTGTPDLHAVTRYLPHFPNHRLPDVDAMQNIYRPDVTFHSHATVVSEEAH